MKQADSLMQQAVLENVFPGGVLCVSKQEKTVFSKAYGKANIYTGIPVKEDTLFDLSSLTKPLATTLCVMKLVEARKLRLSNTLEDCLSGFKGTPKEKITVAQLLNHTSGLPDYRPYYKALKKLPVEKRRKALKNMILKEDLINPVGKETVYSDLGFMILGWIVEDISGEPLNRFTEEKIYSKMGLNSLFFIDLNKKANNPGPKDLEFAATEMCSWRGILIEGAVHDDNAFVTGGVEGHAGLFGTVGDINRLLCELLRAFHGKENSGIFIKEILDIFLKRPANKNRRVLGFDVPSQENSSCGKYFSYNTVGHLGFSGTSFWMDLERSITVILLSNRIHPLRTNEKIKKFRPQLHNAVLCAL
jgi:CubicO group peptidase (beta-lactamase class C family)